MSTIARFAEASMPRSLLRTVGTFLGRVGRACYWEHRETEVHLLSLDDRLLKDIGITRSEILSAVHHGSRPKRGEPAANDANGASGLFYREAGFGRPVVLLHSTAGTGGQWKSLCAALKSHYRVIAPDLPGYGRSPAAGAGEGGLGDDAAPVIALIESLGGPVHLVGHSYGGALALKIAARRPELVRSLCLIEPVVFQLLRNPRVGDRRLLEEVGAVETAIRAGIAAGAPETGMARFIDFWNGEGSWMRLEPELRSHLRDNAEQVVANFAAIANEPASQASMRSLACQTLVIRGERSPGPARRVAELIAAAIPGAAFVEIPRAGHMAPLTHAEAVDPIVTRHIWESEFDNAIPLARQDRGLKPAA